MKDHANVMDSIRLTGKTAIITGGHTNIGFGIATAFAQADVENLVLVGRRKALGEERAAKLKEEYGVNCVFYQADIGVAEDREALVKYVVEQFKRIDILVNDAGIVHWQEAENVSEEDWRRVMHVNVDALFYMTQAVGRVMIAQGGGSIVNISSNADRMAPGPQKHTGYNASKAAVSMMTRSLANEWTPYNIRVNAIAPGYTVSDLLPEGTHNGRPLAEIWKETIPIERFAVPAEIGAAVLFVASDACPFMIGEVLVVDGGGSIR